MRLLRTMVLLNVMLVVGCGGSGGGGGGGDGSADEIDSVSEGLPTEEIDPEPVVMVAQPSTRVSGITYSWPEDFTVIEGDESFSLEEITTDFQRGRLIANPDDTVRCTDGVQLGPNLDQATVDAQVVSNYDGRIISVDDISISGFFGQEVLLAGTSSSGEDTTSIARHYYVTSDRLNLETDNAAVFFISCSAITNNFSPDESIMRSILDSLQFTFSL